MITKIQTLWKRVAPAAALASLGAVALVQPSQAASDCAVYTATMKVNGNVQRVFTTPFKDEVNVPAGAVLEVRGTYNEFDVALDTFAISSYVLTGAPGPNQITNVRTPVFASKRANQGTLTGLMEIELNPSGQNLVIRRGDNRDLKIQAKDCDQGGMFQFEPEPAAIEANTLASGFRYCFQANRSAKRFFINGVVLGYDSPELARLRSGDPTHANWAVQDGGRIGMVLGEDAVQALQDEGPAAEQACPNQTP